jgi:DNA-binding MurR/RpiR family transcriptional regulator
MNDSEAAHTRPLHQRLAALEATLSPAERAVARYLTDHPDLVASATAVELGARTGTSNATVIRTVKALGYTGLPELKRILIQAIIDRRDPARVLDHRIDQLEAEGGIADKVLLATSELMTHARRLIDPAIWDKAVNLIVGAAGVTCYGVEQAGCVADCLAIELGRCGKPARSVKDTGIGITAGILPLRSEDTVVVIAPLRHFREIDVVVDHAKSLGAAVVLISEALGMAFEGRVDAVLNTPQTTLGLASELLTPMALVGALTLEVASRDRERAVRTHKLVNKLRSEVVGADVDVDVSIPRSLAET